MVITKVYYDTVNKRFVTLQFKCCKTDDFTMSTLDVKEAVRDLRKGKNVILQVSISNMQVINCMSYFLLSA